ncbi:MAG TPA: S9 family peptidase [Candidatus Limnocylindria bacterium]|nr:S9 family peptidase [Candidatus Limnocylindria bacterium]
MARAPRPEDLYDLRVPGDVQLSPDGRNVAFTVKAVAPRKDGYRSALWVAASDGSTPPRQLTIGSKNDTQPRWSPDGRTIAFLSDRSAVLQAGGGGPKPDDAEAPKEGGTQVWLLPFADGGEARQLTDLPKDVEGLAWSPDGRRLAVVSGAESTEPEKKPQRKPGDPPEPDTRLIDTLQYQFNGAGFVHDKFRRLWLVDVESGTAELLTRGNHHDSDPRWSPDGRTIAFVSDRHPNADLGWRTDIYLVDVRNREVRQLSPGSGRQSWGSPAWSPDGAWIAAIGTRDWKRGVLRQASVWRIRVRDGREEDLTGAADLEAAAGMNSDLFGGGELRPYWMADGRWIVFAAPVDGSFELWRVEPEGGRIERLTEDRHYLSRADVVALPRGGARVAAVRATATEPPDVVVADLPAGRLGAKPLEPRRLTDLMGTAWRDIRLVAPVERWHEVDGRRIQGWFYPAPGSTKANPAPAVVEIHGGPATLYGWSLIWEWQVLAGGGISVYACNPRGSQGYGQAFLTANVQDWGDGPMRDVLGGLDALIADGLVDPERTGVTGGSYGGYLTSWIVGHTDRFKAAVTCRSVNDMVSQMLSGDIGGPTFGLYEYGVQPWDDWDLYRRHSPLTYAPKVTTPLLIQHAEKDLRCTITQAEELFAVLRSLRRTVRLMRVPDESHELTRSGTPFRRVDNLRLIDEWFRHFLIEGKTRLPRVDPKRG